MSAIPVIAVFDVGKTNKKLFLFDEYYRIVFERTARFIETVDEDGFPCENLESLRLSVFDSLSEIFRQTEFVVKAINFCTYGASFVYINADGKPVTPLYNYLKTYPHELSNPLYNKYGGEEQFSLETASPILGSLNSGLQVYRIRNEQPEIYADIRYALHLPQYMSYLITGLAFSDMTSIGCHTALWDFTANNYHKWVQNEGLKTILAPIAPADKVSPAIFPGTSYKVGIGLHDSSAALIPYLINFTEPFVLISTGTWCISMNPFNQSPLTADELKNDCLNFIQYQGKAVKSSRIFSGYEYEQQVKRIAEHFNEDIIKYRSITYEPGMEGEPLKLLPGGTSDINPLDFQFRNTDLSGFQTDIAAYYAMVADLIRAQVASTNLVLAGTNASRIFVDGGFSKNSVYMNLLAAAFPHLEVFAASMAQATAMGAALVLHKEWNRKPIPNDIIELKYYSSGRSVNC